MEKDKNIIIWIIIAVVVFLILFGGLGMGGYGMMGFGFVFMLLFWILIIWLVVTLVNTGQSSKKESKDPSTILKKRYAYGEITKKQYEEIKKELMKK